MKEPDFESPALIARLLRDPVRLRRRAWLAALLVSLTGGIAGSGWNPVDDVAGILIACAWLLVPAAAAGIGMGDAFFLRHGIGRRRVLVTLAVSTLVAAVSCALLAAVVGAESGRELLSATLYFGLILAVISWLGSAVGLAVGRSGDYLSRKIQNVDDRGW